MRKKHMTAFTLVELIVTITILAILGTIGFISFLGYAANGRDSVRITDLRNIFSVLEHNVLKTGTYSQPDDPFPVTFSGGTLWNQGTFGETAFRGSKGMSEAPKDPLTDTYYTYSLASNGSELQLASLFERESLAMGESQLPSLYDETYAATGGSAYVIGNYNEQVLKIETGGLTYIFALPSIISSDRTEPNIVDIVADKKLVFDGMSRIPHSYGDTAIQGSMDDPTIEIEKLIVWSGSLDTLKNDSSARFSLIENLSESYSGTVHESTPTVANTLELTDQYETISYVDQLVANTLKVPLSRTSSESGDCVGAAHGIEKAFYAQASVPFGDTCESIQQDYLCYDGSYRAGDTFAEADLGTLSDTCIVTNGLTCSQTTTDGYTHNSLAHQGSENTSKIVGGTNGNTTYTASVSCYNGTTTMSNEVEGNLTCDANYTLVGQICEPICIAGGPVPCIAQ